MKPFPFIGVLGACLTVAPLAVSNHTAFAAGDAPPAARSSESLPDSAVLARVEDRVIRVYDMRDRYFSSEAMSRPTPDSLGRLEFLNTMIGKEVLGLTAVKRNQPLSFEDRLRLTEMANSAIARIFYDRRVTDQAVVTEKDIAAVHPQFGVELKLRNMTFDDRAVADRVRDEVTRGKQTWKQAAQRHAGVSAAAADADLGWISRSQLDALTALVVFELKPSGISPVIANDQGFTIWQCIDRRPTALVPLSAVRRTILFELKEARSAPLREKFFAEVGRRAEARYDTATVIWLADQFRTSNPAPRSTQTTIDLRNRIPRLAPADTGRVLATSHRGPFTVDRFLTVYRSVPSMLRISVSSPTQLMNVLQRMLLEPDVIEFAKEEGLERDPEYVAFVAQRREAMLVEALYEDSVVTKVRVTEAQRRKYYDDHRPEFLSRERVTYAVIPRRTEQGADSVIARLAAGESPAAIVRSDSLAGGPRGVVRSAFRDEPNDYSMWLYEEMKPGDSKKIGDRKSTVLHVIDHDYSREMSYAEVVPIVDESVQNIEAERQLAALVKRLSKRYRVESHPELIMRFPLTDPMAEWRIPSGD